MKINEFQRAVLESYADGEFKHLLEEEELPPLGDLGDGLLAFLLVELSDGEDCEDIAVARGRVVRARDELEVVMEALALIMIAVEAKEEN